MPGDFYLDQNTDTLYGPKAESGSGTAVSSMASKTPDQILPYDGSIGQHLIFNAPGQITALRYYRGAANTLARPLKLWTVTGTLLGLVTTSETVGFEGWFEAPIAPQVVTAGQTFVASYDVNAGDKYSYSATTPTSDTADITIGLSCYGTANVFPATTRAAGHFADVVLFKGTAVWPIAMSSASGGGVTKLEFNFASPLTSWVLAHNLGTTTVEVNCYDLTGVVEFDPEIEITNPNTVTVKWYYPTSGIARVIG